MSQFHCCGNSVIVGEYVDPVYMYRFTNVFEVKLTFDMLTVRGQQLYFSIQERVFLWKCQSFETENVSTWGGLEPPTFGFMPNALTYWAIKARHLLSHGFEVKLTFDMLIRLSSLKLMECNHTAVSWYMYKFTNVDK